LGGCDAHEMRWTEVLLESVMRQLLVPTPVLSSGADGRGGFVVGKVGGIIGVSIVSGSVVLRLEDDEPGPGVILRLGGAL
jgi:hypothetical protein